MKALLLEPGKEARMIEIENKLEALQEAVGGYTETVTFAPDACLIVNEEGVLLALPQQQVMGWTLYGNVLVVGVDGENFTDVPEAAVKAVMG